MNQNPSQRRHRRVPIQIPVQLISTRQKITALTEDISHSGVFIRTDTPSRLRQLVKFRLRLPDTDQELRMLAMTVYTLTPDQAVSMGRTPGMGMNLYGLDPDMQQTWKDFVDRAIKLYDTPGLEPPHIAGQIEPVRRSNPRYVAELRVRVEHIDQLSQALTRNISLGGAFLATKALTPPGERIRLTFIHPRDNSGFSIGATVLRTVESPTTERGMAVRFDVNPNTRDAFKEFIEEGLLEISIDDSLFISPQDPRLV